MALQGYNLSLPISAQNGLDLDFILNQAEAPDPPVILPQGITDVKPARKSCSIELYDLGRDPPRTLVLATNMVAKGISAAVSSQPSHGVASPQSTSHPPIPRRKVAHHFRKTLRQGRRCYISAFG